MRYQAKRALVAPDFSSRSVASATLVRVGLAMAVACFFFGLVASPALALPDTYLSIGKFGTGPGSGPAEFDPPSRAAVDYSTGNLYVVDRGNDRIQVFKPEGTSAAFLTEVDAGGTLDNPFGVAIDESASPVDLYVTDAANNRIVKLSSDGAPVPGFSIDPTFTSPAAGSGPGEVGDFAAPIAVDPTNGDLLVGDPADDLMQRYDSSGAFVGSFDGSSSPNGAFGELLDLAVDPAGNVVVLSGTRIERFDAAGAHQLSLEPGTPQPTTVAVDPNTGYILVGGGSSSFPPTRVFVFDEASLLAEVAVLGADRGQIRGIAVDGGSSQRLYVAHNVYSLSPSTGKLGVEVFKPGTRPVVDLDPASQVTSTTAHLSATVNPGGAPTTWHFEYSSDGSDWFQPSGPNGETGSETTPVPVAADADGLLPNTEYRVRLIAVNEAGTVTSSETTFVTDAAAPLIGSQFAGPVTPGGARLNAKVNPNGEATAYFFEYGTDATYGSSVPAGEDGDAGSGGDFALASQELSGLAPGTRYHFRVVARNATGTAAGADTTFVTPAIGSGPPARGIELVNNPDKGNQNALPNVPPISPDSSKVLWTTFGGAPGGVTGNRNLFFAERGATGWHSQSVLPPASELFGHGGLAYEMVAASPSFSSFVFKATSGVISKNELALVRLKADGSQDVLHVEPGGVSSTGAFAEVRASDDLSHVYLNSLVPIDPSHVSGTNNVYDFGSGTPELVSRMPDTGQAPPCGVALNAGPQDFAGSSYEWISTAPGAPARAYFEVKSDPKCSGLSPRNLYMRDLDADTTTLVSGPLVAGQVGDSRFLRASDDGSKAIFASQTKLSPRDNNEEMDLYRFTVGGGNECLTCGFPEARVVAAGGLNRGVAVSDDLSRVYFQSSKVLVPGEGTPGAQNLYLLHEGRVEFIAERNSGLDESTDIAMPQANGRVIAFSSSVEGNTADATGGFEQVYRYDDGDKSLVCMTCPSAGAATAASAGFGGNVDYSKGIETLSADGGTFAFITAQALDPDDVNQEDDIYTWRNGQVRIVTDGFTKYPSAGFGALTLVGVSPNAADVLFTAGVNFTGWERDHVAQLYTARVGGGFPPPPTPAAACDEDDCQGPLQAPPGIVTPSSLSATGPGNEKPRAKRPRKARGKKHRHRRKAHRRRAHGKRAHGKAHGKRRHGKKAHRKGSRAATKGGRRHG